ncbi:MAG: TIGR03747 family integrating conjugative element membrane protein [Gammaproteobacteria bacterium]
MVARTPEKRIPQQQHTESRSLAGRFIASVTTIVGLLVVSLFFSLIAEWVGLAFYWTDQGSRHSAQMLKTELGYLDQDFRRKVFYDSPANIAQAANQRVYNTLVVKSRFRQWRRGWLSPVSATEPRFRQALKYTYRKIDDYVMASINIIQVFATRLVVIALSFPVYILFGVCALIDGLVQRDLRRYGAGREHGRVYHIAKQYHTPIILMTAFTYLSIPVSIHPNWVFIPAALLFAMTIYITATTYQKFL